MGAIGSGTGILMAVTIIYSCKYFCPPWKEHSRWLTYALRFRLGDWNQGEWGIRNGSAERPHVDIGIVAVVESLLEYTDLIQNLADWCLLSRVSSAAHSTAERSVTPTTILLPARRRKERKGTSRAKRCIRICWRSLKKLYVSQMLPPLLQLPNPPPLPRRARLVWTQPDYSFKRAWADYLRSTELDKVRWNLGVLLCPLLCPLCAYTDIITDIARLRRGLIYALLHGVTILCVLQVTRLTYRHWTKIPHQLRYVIRLIHFWCTPIRLITSSVSIPLMWKAEIRHTLEKTSPAMQVSCGSNLGKLLILTQYP
jgi:hypothetical protein